MMTTAVSAAIGVPSFVFVQWVAPFVSEFPEKVSAFYWARTVERAPMALMNMVSSNINQWTLLTAMLPIVYSISRGAVSDEPVAWRRTVFQSRVAPEDRISRRKSPTLRLPK